MILGQAAFLRNDQAADPRSTCILPSFECAILTYSGLDKLSRALLTTAWLQAALPESLIIQG